jgi:hypothetical protein
MTEADWLSCGDPEPMLAFLRRRVSARRYRLFACACCRRIGHLLPVPAGHDMIVAAERFADGEITEEEFKAVKTATRGVDKHARDAPSGTVLAFYAAREAVDASARSSACNASHMAVNAVAIAAVRASGFDIAQWAVRQANARIAEKREQANVLRDVIGNPFHPQVVDRAWLEWNNQTVARLAAHVYEERAFEQMPILGDALEEAGCDNAMMLAHCREKREHVSGCWLVDLLLAKE